jgi:hypothetical protein
MDDRSTAKAAGLTDDREPILARARDARTISARLAEAAPSHRARWESAFSACLLTRDRIEKIAWSGGGGSPQLGELLHQSRVRYTRLVGRDPLIDEAKRAVMLRVGCSPDDAFQVLRSVSQRRNVKLAVVAREVVDSASSRPAVRRAG